MQNRVEPMIARNIRFRPITALALLLCTCKCFKYIFCTWSDLFNLNVPSVGFQRQKYDIEIIVLNPERKKIQKIIINYTLNIRSFKSRWFYIQGCK